MIDFIEYVVAELKSKRLSKANAAQLVKQFSVCRSGSSAAPVIHPLLHSNTSDLSEQRYSSVFTGEEFFLAEHQVKTSERMVQKVLPGVAYLEMARAAVKQALPARRDPAVLELRNITWAQPIIVTGSKQVSIALFANEGDKIEYEIYSQAGEQEVIHCQGVAVLAPQTSPVRLDIEQLKHQMTNGKVEPDGIYPVFTRMGLIYGPAFQGITAIYQSKDQVLAYLRLPTGAEDKPGDYILHPSLMDSALQACIGLMQVSPENSSQPRLPFALESLRILSPCTSDMIAWLRYAKGSHADDTVVKLDIDLCDEQGNVCVALRGFSSRILKDEEKKNRHLGPEIQPGLQQFAPVWNPVNSRTHKKTSLPQTTKILMLGGDPTHLEWVQKSYPAAYSVPLPSIPAIHDVEAELRGCSFDHLLWIAPDVAQTDVESSNDNDLIIEQQELGVITVFRIMKALLRLGYGDRELQWTIITSKTQRVKRDDGIHPAHAGIFGLVGSVAKEFPHWNLNLLDVDSLASVAADECLSITPDRRGNGLACRKGEWFRQEFAHIPVLEQSLPVPYRQKGVYLVIGGAGGLGEVWTRFMIERYQANVVWIGRHERNSAIEDKIKSLARVGHAPLYISADATKLDALEQALKTVLKIYPAVHGVIHSAIVLRDQSIARMEESEFRASLSAKVDISVNIDRVFGRQELDFMLFFSSVMSFVKGPGQSNYAAGCTFKDSFAQKLQQQRAYAIKTMNWGYWGKVGIVADERHKKTMESMGIGSIEPNEGMECLQAFACSGLNQMGLIKVSGARTIADLTFTESLTCYSKVPIMEPLQLPENLVAKVTTNEVAAVADRLGATGLEDLLAEILASTLLSLGLLTSGLRRFADLPLDKQPAAFYERWLSSSIRYLQEQKVLGPDLWIAAEVRALGDLWAAWEARKSVWTSQPGLQAQIRLLEVCVKALPGILTGKQFATDVMFPHSSMQLVEGIYRNNATADYFNEALGERLSAYVEQMLRLDKLHKVRILEIGAGTGGTTAKLIPLLQRFPIEEYCYTDVSKAFLIHAEEHYRPKFPALMTAPFDVSKPLASQAIPAGHYDVVIAANVLHATPNIRETLRNAKAALRNRGVLLLNEISAWSLFAHLTFGLLEGWWLHEDTAVRLPGSPGLAPEKWREILIEEGFESISFPAGDAHKFGQQIIVGSSDGWVRQQLNTQPVVVPEHKHPVSAITTPAKAVSSDEKSIHKKAVSYFQKLVASVLKMRHGQLDPRRPLADYGLDSILVGQLTYQLRKTFSDITTTLFFEVQSIDGLVDYFLQNKKQELVTVLSMSADAPQPLLTTQVAPKAPSTQDECRPRSSRRASARHIAQEQKTLSGAGVQQVLTDANGSVAPAASILDVAVIGLSGRYPQSRNLKEFWRNLSNGVNCITEIPRERWNWETYYDSERGKSGKIYTKWGGFIDGIDQFDPLFFKISPTEARRMDPQERVFLECCYHAIEDAGYTPENLGASEKIGVFVGVMNSRYTPQPVHSSIANRVSYLFNFQGPSMAVDTACSASLTAIHVALESIYSGLSECAIAGGVNLIIDPVHYLQLTDMTVLSSGNQCKAFGEQADGFVDAEGVGAVVLKPLKQAELDGDHIYAVIKGSAINAGGRTNGYTVPNPKAQAKVVAQALERAHVKAEHLTYVEAHGTGTALGDPIEIAGLTRAFKETGDKKQYCSIGSVKSNIGHCESAAGIAGLTKILLQLKYEQLAPSLHSDVPNPEISFEQTPFKVQKNLEKWHRPLLEVNGVVQELPRIAGVSSFGAGGANAHVVVQEYVQPETSRKPAAFVENSKVIVLSARTPEQLRHKASDLLSFIREEGQSAIASGKTIDLDAMAYTLHVGREAMEERLGFVVSSVEQLAEKLQAYVSGKHGIEDAYEGQVKRNREALSLFSTDFDLQQTIDKWIADRKASKLLELWVKGLDLDWSKLYGDSKPQRISLPTYPFAKERYWMETVVERQVATTTVLHPLLHRNTSDLSEQRYSSTFTGNEFFLADHMVKTNGRAGQKVLPGVAYLEMARAAMEQALPAGQESAMLELRDVAWAQPMVVSGNQQIHIALWPNDHDEVEFEIYGQDLGQEIVYCQGRAVWPREVAAPGKLNVEQLKESTSQGKLEQDGLYAALARMGLAYGPSFQALAAVHQGSGQVLAQLRLPKAAEDASQEYVLHPGMMDSALQAAIGLIESGLESEKPRLPFALEKIRILSRCSRDMLAWVRYSPSSQAGDKIVKLDLDLCDEFGNICVQMRGLSSRVLTQEIGTSAAQGKAFGKLLAVPIWQVSEAREPAGASHSEYNEHHVVLCDLSKVNARELESLIVSGHCLPLQAEQGKNIAQRYSEYALACFERLKTILQSRPQGRVLVQIVVAGQQEQALLAGFSGLLRTAALENSQLAGQLLLVPPEVATQELARHLQAEMRQSSDQLVRYEQGVRQVMRWKEAVDSPEMPPVPFKDRGTYLITGGLGGLGVLFAKEILEQAAHATVVLTGRSAWNAEKQALLERLSLPAERVSYRQMELHNLNEVRQLINAIQEEYGQLNGILHSAGMIADNFILKKTNAEFSEVLRPKVTGTYHLDQASQDVELDFFVLFSSAAGALGNVGQADYAAANGFMDQFAAYRNMLVAAKQRHGQTRSINWGAWQAGGMATDAAIREMLEETTGMRPMQTATGIQAFYCSLMLPNAQVLVAQGDLPRLRRALIADGAALESQAKNSEIAEDIDSEILAAKTQDYLRRELSELLQLPSHKIDPQASLEDYGIDSILAMKLTSKLEKTFGPLSKTLFFEYQTIAGLAGYFLKAHPAVLREQVTIRQQASIEETTAIATEKNRCSVPAKRSHNRFAGVKTNDRQEIAIIGLAGRYPQAANLLEFWKNLQNGRDCITEIPSERWDYKLYYDPDPNTSGKSYAKWGGFIADVDKFDPLFFNISPREAALIDPQERLFLETVWETIEDAGYTKASISGSRVGVFVGVMWGQYELFGVDSILSGDAAMPSSSYASIANRISYFFDFHGPSIALDTMCSSSLTAMHLACEEIRKGGIDAAIAGGVNVTVHPSKYLTLSQGKFAASDGKCRSFGQGGDGYVPGEGVGAILLKPLEKALRDGDQIYAVVKSSALNHGGKTNGYTVPNPNAQGDLILNALKQAGIGPETLGYIETHGTGTFLGDPIEITGLLKAFEGSAAEKQVCPIGSVKSNIGHLESAAGIAAVTKALLQIKYKQLVPSLHADPPNPNINFKDSPFYVQTELAEWKHTAAHPRRAGVSSFGAGGSNAHLILEEYSAARELEKTPHSASPQLFVLSARNWETLRRYAEKVITFVENVPDVSLEKMAYTSQVGRTPMDARLVVIASSVKDLRDKLNQWLALPKNTEKPSGTIHELDNIFSGNAREAQYSARELVEGRAGKAFLADLFENKDLERLARFWVLGVEIDWSLLYHDTTPGKVSLPTYPFARERYWIKANQQVPVPDAFQKTALHTRKFAAPEHAEEKRRAYYYPHWRSVDVSGEKCQVTGPILMLDTSEDLFLAMKEQPENSSGAQSIALIKPGKSFQEISPNVYVIDPEREEQFQELIENLKSKTLFPEVVLHHCSDVCNLEVKEEVTQHLNHGVYALFYLSKVLMKEKHQVPLKFLSAFSSHSELAAPLGTAVAGFFKTLALENPQYLIKTVEIPCTPEISLAEKAGLIWKEIYEKHWTAKEIRYGGSVEQDQQRYARCIRELASYTHVESRLSALPLKHNGVYLITGGLGGLGLIFAEYLAKHFQSKLVLCGRSAPNSGQQEQLRHLRTCGAETLVLQADASKLEDMERVVREAKAQFSEINGIIHAAGVNRDSFILNKTKEEMETVLSPKVYGTINLDLVTNRESLDFFVLFSSIAGVLGNPGQSDYAYGNHFLDSFAETREALRKAGKRSGRTLSINWPLWEEGGMGISQDAVSLLEQQTGICPVATQDGIQYWEDFLRSEKSQAIALYGIPSRIAAFIAQQSARPDKDVAIQTAGVDTAMLLAKTEEYLKTLIGEEIKLAPDRIGSSDRLESFGIDSVMIHRLNINLEKDLGALPKTLLYQHETVQELAQFLLQQARNALIKLFGLADSAGESAILPAEIEQEGIQDEKSSEDAKDGPGPIAIIGIHGYYPHSATLAEYWENLKAGKDLTGLVPPDRWDYKEFYHPDPAAAADGKIYCKWGGFLDNYDKFDPQFFKISSEEARIIDPQERLFLQSVWAAIEDAGYTRESMKNSCPKGRSADVGVFVGVTTNSYHLWGPEERNRGNNVCPSALPWSVANRVSYFFDFNGPSMPVDTACSSSLVAVHLACESLKNRECQVAIAGGVNLYLHPSKYQSLCQRRMLSLDGKCHSYGAGDDGFVPGEGVGTLVLKPLSKAIEHQDHIYAIIPASAYDHSGRSNGYSAPNPNSQANLISHTLKKARIHPETIDYVEGHGTGTQLGDGIEIAALNQAFQSQTAKQQFCSIGSVKANIGHSESAAGVASIAKVILQLKHQQLVPSIHSEKINPNIELKDLPFYLQHELSDWKSSPAHPRRALINSFGAGGVNACVIVEEYQEPGSPHNFREAGPHLLVLSARNEHRLREYVDNLLIHLQSEQHVDLADLCYTLQVSREAMEDRLAIVASEVNDLIDTLNEWNKQGSASNAYHGSARPSQQRSKLVKTAGQSLGEIASRWVASEQIDWNSLYPGTKPRRIPLPTYPFARERYWISNSLVPEKRAVSVAQLHPLISYNSSTLKEVSFSSSLSDTAFYALDHKVNEEGIFPGAGFLEMAFISGSIAAEHRVRKITDVVWIRPLSFRRGPQTVRTFLKYDGDIVEYVVSSLDDENETILHSEGKLAFSSDWTAPADGTYLLPIETLKAQCAKCVDGNEYYSRFTKYGLNYGPSFQTIQEVYISDSFALSRLKLPDHLKDDFGQFLLHPSMIDGALQTVGGLVAGQASAFPHLPFALDELDILHPVRQTCYAYVEFAGPREQNHADIQKFNIRLLNESGDVLINFRNLIGRALPMAQISPASAETARLAVVGDD
jgi:polyketide synthase PksN